MLDRHSSLAHGGANILDYIRSNSTNIYLVIGSGVLAHSLYSYAKTRRGRYSRNQRRKLVNRKRRWFVDNIIMHHKRIHDKERESKILDMRKKILESKKKKETFASRVLESRKKSERMRDKSYILNNSRLIKERVNLKRLRAESRWGVKIS